ncbi:FadR/GntR family transcriptional regulator [Sneathiella aquimaris]|uniref:FadR/GntR family transcriptional regulator n=1 Tax=Sneathiella aquimaris TaxID=2599305 RepID=UPI00146C0239|nr:FadR/GntR family transcriptional regulator [Sneathiella aquimaris]
MTQLGNRHYPRGGIHGRVVHELGQDIVSGRYKPGDKLPGEGEFLEMFKGSRTAIREAFRVLTAKGLLEAKQRAGTRVRPRSCWNLLDPDILAWQSEVQQDHGSVIQMMELRQCFQPGIANLAAQRGSLDQLALLDGFQRQMENAEEVRDQVLFFKAVRNFHGCLFDCCQNDLASRLNDVVDVVLVALYQTTDNCLERQAFGMAGWYRLAVEKIMARDGVSAERLFHNLIENERSLLLGPKKSTPHFQTKVA